MVASGTVPWLSRLRRFATVASGFVIVVGCLALAGWVSGIEVFRSVVPGLTAMNPVSALGFILAGLALFVLQPEQLDRRGLRVGRTLAGVVLLLGLVRLVGYLIGADDGILDQLLFRAKLDTYDPPNRMSPNTALNFLLIGIALLTLDTNTRRSRRPSQLLAVIAGVISLLAIIGYSYHTLSFTRLTYAHQPMSLNSAMAFVVLCAGVLCARPDRGLMAVITGDGPGSMMARRLLPAAIVIPAILGYLRVVGQAFGFFDPVFGSSLFVILIIVTISSLIWFSAASLNRSDRRRRHAEDALLHERDELRTSREQARMVVDTAYDAYIAMDADGRIVDWNRQAETTFGWSRAEVVGRLVAETIIPPRYREAHARGLKHFLATGEGPVLNQRIEIVALRRDDREFPVELTVTPLPVGSSFLFNAFVHDITNRKRAEQAVQTARDAAETANRAKSEFLANMSHEIRTPMNAIIGITDLVLDTDLSKSQREYLKMVQESAEGLLTLINDILDFSKIEAGKLDLDRIPFSLRERLGDSMKLLACRAHSKGLELACHVHPDVPDAVVGDPGRLRQIVVNLVGNSIKFTERGEVVLDVQSKSHIDGQVVLHFTVRDTGIGIPPEKLGSLFQAFEQLDASTTRKYGGTGLGLAISKRLVQFMGGQIWVESELGRGSKFHFTAQFPVTTEAVTETPFAEVAVVHDVPVLIVDDNATNRVILEEIIRTWGMAPVTAANAREALLKLREAHTRERPVRLMLVDLNMPDADGYTLIEWVRRDELLRATIAIMLTSGSRPGDLTRSKDLQVAAHLMKPVKPSELFDAIGTSLGMLAAESHEATASSQQLPPLRVLLAEDSTVNQKLAVGLLGKHGHSVTVANHGKEAVQLWQSQAFDVVLMDVQMPEMDGFDATAVIRAQEVGTGHRIPIIAMTANAMKGDREQCLEAGMDDYISKPIRVEQLFETLSRVLRTNRGLVHSVVPAPLSDDVQYVNLSAALKSAGDDAQLFGEIARAFLEESSQLMTQISDAVRSGNSAKLTHSAHTLKGVLNTVAADGAAEIAQQVEQMGRQQDLAGAEQPLAELERLVTHIRFQLANFASETSPSRRQEFADSS